MNKRGVSGVIVAVLMILIVIAAVVILWSVISGFLTSSTDKIGLGLNTLNVEVESASFNQGDLYVKVHRDGSKGDMYGVKVLVSDETGNSDSVVIEKEIGQLETSDVIVNREMFEDENLDFGKISRIVVTPAVKSGDEYSFGSDDEYVVENRFLSDDGLVLYLPFEGDVMDKSGNVESSDLINNNVLFVPSKNGFGQAGKFVKTSPYTWINIDIVNSPLQDTDGFTVSSWVKLETAPDGVGRVIASTYSHSEKKGWTLGEEYGSSDNMEFSVMNSNTYHATIPNFFRDYGNDWAQVIGVYKPGELRLFINGEMVVKSTAPNTISYPTLNKLRVGHRADSSKQGMWDGGIDELRFYDRALSDDEIYYLYRYN